MRVEDFLARLKNVKQNGSGAVACCPAHEDKRASLSVSEGDDGRILLHCHAGCETTTILSAIGLEARDLFPEDGRGRQKSEIVATYDYTDEKDALLYQVVRLNPKDFRQRRPDGAGGWTWNLNGQERVPFRLSRVLDAARGHGVLWVVEGEKDVLRLEELGLVATTNAGGAGKWTSRYAEAMRGARGVYIVPDNDKPGRKHAEDVARSVHDLGIPAKIVELPGVPEKGDVSDWLARGGTVDGLRESAVAAPVWEPRQEPIEDTPSTSVLVRLDTVKAERVSWLWPGRIPYGKLTVLDGDPGKGKSALSVDLAARVTVGDSMPYETIGQEPGGVVILTAEDGLADTVRPRLQAAGGDASRVVALDAVRLPGGGCRMPTLSDVENIREAIAFVKAKLVIIDPIMAYLGTKDGHKDQDVRSIAHPVAHLAEETGVAVVLIRHLTKGEKANPIYRGGGSIGIAGAARSVLLVASDREDPELRVLASVKSNLSAPPPSLSYRLVPEGDVVRVAWKGPVDVTAAALLAAQGAGEEADGLEGAQAFLRELLADAPARSKDLFSEARQAGIKDRTLERAKAALGVKATRQGFGRDGVWYWELPAIDRQTSPKGAKDERGGLWPPVAVYGEPTSPAASAETPAEPDPAACPRCHTDTCAGDCFTLRGTVYRVGDVLPDGRPVLDVDRGIPVLGRRS